MSYRLSYATVRESKGQAIHAVRVHGEILELDEIDDLAMRLRERLASRGELDADVVVVQGEGKTSLRLFGLPYSTGRVRAAMFNAAIRWSAIDLD